MSEKELNRIIAKNLTEQLEKKGKTQLELAEYMGVSQPTVSSWCRGEKMPRMKKIDMICDFFNITRSELMEEPGSQKPNPNTLAAHFDSTEYTAEELEEIKQFAAFVKSKRDK